MILRYYSVLPLVENLNGADSKSKRLGISHFIAIGLFTGTTEEAPDFREAERNIVKNPKKASSFPSA